MKLDTLDCSLVVAFYLVGSLSFGNAGAIICFVLPPAASLLFGAHMIARDVDRIAWKTTTWLALIKYLIAGSFGRPTCLLPWLG